MYYSPFQWVCSPVPMGGVHVETAGMPALDRPPCLPAAVWPWTVHPAPLRVCFLICEKWTVTALSWALSWGIYLMTLWWFRHEWGVDQAQGATVEWSAVVVTHYNAEESCHWNLARGDVLMLAFAGLSIEHSITPGGRHHSISEWPQYHNIPQHFSSI